MYDIPEVPTIQELINEWYNRKLIHEVGTASSAGGQADTKDVK